jgi:hypothetical protein
MVWCSGWTKYDSLDPASHDIPIWEPRPIPKLGCYERLKYDTGCYSGQGAEEKRLE